LLLISVYSIKESVLSSFFKFQASVWESMSCVCNLFFLKGFANIVFIF
jgi:hypothetical protein